MYKRTMHRTPGFLVALVIAAAVAAFACGGGTDKPPLTPDDGAGAMPDAGDMATPPADPNAPQAAAPTAK